MEDTLNLLYNWKELLRILLLPENLNEAWHPEDSSIPESAGITMGRVGCYHPCWLSTRILGGWNVPKEAGPFLQTFQ
jgi:hypothetical protein